MDVAELRQLLSNLNDDAEVVFQHGDFKTSKVRTYTTIQHYTYLVIGESND